MNSQQNLRSFSTDVSVGSVIAVDLEIVCLWSALGLTLTALFLILGFRLDLDQTLMLSG
jgi:hypothetical protein